MAHDESYTTLPELVTDAKAGKFDHNHAGMSFLDKMDCIKCSQLQLAVQWDRFFNTRLEDIEIAKRARR